MSKQKAQSMTAIAAATLAAAAAQKVKSMFGERRSRMSSRTSLPQSSAGGRTISSATGRTRRRPRGDGSRGEMQGLSMPAQTGTLIAPRRVNAYCSTETPQANTDQGDCQGDWTRIRFEDMFSYKLGQSTGASTMPFYTGTLANANVSSVSFRPGLVSTRLQNLCSGYQFIAIRELDLTYCPTLGTSANGQLAWGIVTNIASDVVNTTAVTAQTVMEYRPAACFPVWKQNTLRYRFNGSRLWSTSSYAGGTTSLESGVPGYSQIAITGALDPLATSAGTALQLGNIWCSGVIDLYRESPTVQSPAVFLNPKETALVASYIKESDWQAHYASLVQLASRRAALLSSDEEKDSPVLVSAAASAAGDPKRSTSRPR